MFRCALLLAAAWIQAPSTLAERLGLEGPLANDTDQGCNAEAQAALAAGDAALAKSNDETARRAAFEHWRRALVSSSPLDCVAVDARRTTSVASAVRARIAATGAAEFAARFDGLATSALAAAGASEPALERVAYENPFTRAGRIASLRLCDAALERGASARARAALTLLRAERAEFDAGIAAAFDLRSRSLASPSAPSRAPAAVPAARALEFVHTIDFGPSPRPNADRMLEPGVAEDLEGVAWIQSGERLIRIARDGTHAIFDPEKLVAESQAHGVWLPAFGDADRAWLQRPALENTTLAVVLGRARETRGNALAVFDVARGTPRLAWLRHDAEHPDEAVLPGRLEFQPGPVVVDGLVIVQILQWEQDGAGADAQHVDGRHTRAWLAAFEGASGRVAWRRLLASGADRRALALDRMDTVRSTSLASLPLMLAWGRSGPDVVAGTELGVAARVSALDGRLGEGLALKRVPRDPRIRPGSGLPFTAFGGLAAVAPADADEFVYLLGDDQPWKIFRVPGLDRLLGLDEEGLLAVAVLEERGVLERVELASGARTTSMPFARGAACKGGIASGRSALVAAGDGLALYGADLALAAELRLPDLENEHHVGLWTSGSRVLVVGEGRVWIVRAE